MKSPAPDTPSLIPALLKWALLLIGLLTLASAALARDDDIPGRVGRVVQTEGRASIYDQEQDRWVDAQRNRALTEGDRLSTETGALLQVAIGSTELRLAGDSELLVERLDDDRIRLVLQQGSLAVRVRNADITRELDVRAGHIRVWPERVGHFRVDQAQGATSVTAWRGSLRIDTQDQRLNLEAGRSVEMHREGQDATAVTWGGVAQDAFSDWVSRDEQQDDRLASGERHVSPEMTGAEELDRNGRWDRHPELGWVWLPLQVAVDWAPFRYGRWTWHARWGWTWLDDAPWGFATSHYGRWMHWGGRWVWAPGTYVSRPVYAPALVAWTGGSPGVSVSIGVGPAVGWLPLAPWDVYVPPFRYPPRYFDRVNLPHRRSGIPPQVPRGPVSYGNHGVPNAVTVVPAQVIHQRQPVAPAIIRDGDARRWSGGGFQNQSPIGAPEGRMRLAPGARVPPRPADISAPPPQAEASSGRVLPPERSTVTLPRESAPMVVPQRPGATVMPGEPAHSVPPMPMPRAERPAFPDGDGRRGPPDGWRQPSQRPAPPVVNVAPPAMAVPPPQARMPSPSREIQRPPPQVLPPATQSMPAAPPRVAAPAAPPMAPVVREDPRERDDRKGHRDNPRARQEQR